MSKDYFRCIKKIDKLSRAYFKKKAIMNQLKNYPNKLLLKKLDFKKKKFKVYKMMYIYKKIKNLLKKEWADQCKQNNQ